MAKTSRQTAIFGTEDWKRIYKTYKEADLQSYNFETIRKTFVDYLRQHHPETFNDFTESSEYIALLDLMAFMGQGLAFRSDLNTRENFLDTAERTDSVNNLATLVSYTPKRNETARGYLKILSASTTENITDYNRNNLGNVTIRWNDKTNDDWQEQLTTVLNAALVDSQKIGQPGHSANLVGIQTDEYEINMEPGFLPVVPFSSSVDGTAMDFEIVNGTSINEEAIYEPAPQPNGQLNLLYRNDNQGFASANTGYFFYFKQGTLQTQDFTLAERIANKSIEIDQAGVNNHDVWLFKTLETSNEAWSVVGNIYAANNTQAGVDERKFFSLTSRASDRITFNFGDGVFSEIPVGDFRAYVRESNGLEYVINPEEIQNIDINVSYFSKTGRNETLTLTIGLQEPVSNAKAAEALDDIKRRAPARFYTQNRMVNGEDYNNFPYATYSSITKSKAINRTNIGASRYLDLVDPTGKYSSINAFAGDGLIYRDSDVGTFNFTFTDRNDITSVFRNQVEPVLAERSMTQFYYENFSRVNNLTPADLQWVHLTTTTNETSGYFKDGNGAKPIGPEYVSDDRQYLTPQALIQFVPPTGYHFSATNKLVVGPVSAVGDKLIIWATITSVVREGTANGTITTAPAGTVGPVKLNNFIPSDAIPAEIIPLFNSDLPVDIEQDMVTQVELLRTFAIGFAHEENRWYIIVDDNLDRTGPFSLVNAEDITNQNLDASWLVMFESTASGYTVSSRALHYLFSSIIETRFFYDKSRKIFDPKTGTIINDFINVLKTNSKPDTSDPLSTDVIMDIIDQSVEPDGYVNDYKVEISFTDTDSDGVADDPDFFRTLVETIAIGDPLPTYTDKNVYFQQTIDFDNLERYLPISSTVMNDEYATEADIDLVKTEYATGQLFYATTEEKFFELTFINNVTELSERVDFQVKTGRDGIHFQYRHNSPETRRINPSVTNIIDIYVVTASYHEAYLRYIQDITNTVEEPAVPTTDELTVAYSELQDSKMTSDNVVLNSVEFKPLFGAKAASTLQSFIKVVKLNNVITSDSEIKSKVISSINKYFDIDIWDFGDTFYFSELSAYIHSELGDIIASVVIVPKDATKSFGGLYEIRSAPYEIFTSAATVNDVTIIDALTASNIQNGAG